MRSAAQFACLVILSAALTPHLFAEDADEVRERGVTALKESQANPRAIVDAARFFVKAGELYNTAGNEEKVVEMNSFLYWCKKKMTLEDIDAFTKGGEAHVTSKLEAVEKAVPKDDAQKVFDRAEQFAKTYSNEHLLIAVRFFEVADRFKGTDAALRAMDRSLKELLQEKSGAVKTVAQPTTAKAADTTAADAGKRPIPPADALKAAEKLVRDLFKEDFAKRDAASRLALAAKLLQQADENKTDAAAEYVCLHEARDAAVIGGDAAKAVETQTRLRDGFKTDCAATLLDLKKLETSAKSAESATALVSLLAREAETALAAADFDAAVRFNSHAEDLLPLSKDAALKARMKTEIPRVQAIKKESVAALAAQKTLATKPDDAEANLVAGKFALLLGDAEKGMALLAKSKDGVLAALAKSELSPPTDAAEQTKLADGWLDRAEKETSSYLKARMHERAGLWYTSALPGLSGLQKLKVEGKLKGLPQAAAAAQPGKGQDLATKNTINMLTGVAVDRDSIKGKWKLADGVLSSDASARTTLQISYTPPGEYDCRVVFERVSGNDSMFLFLVSPGAKQQFYFSIGGYNNSRAGFGDMGRKKIDTSPASTSFSLQNNTRYQLLIQIRRDSVAALMDGRPIVQHKTDYADFAMPGDFSLKSKNVLGVGSIKSVYNFHEIQLAPPGGFAAALGRWISQNATCKLSTAAGEMPVPSPNLFNGKGGGWRDGAVDDMGFTTTNETDPWIIIDLKDTYDLKTVELVGRKTLPDRNAPLIMYRGATEDGPWTEIWRTDAKKDVYEAPVTGKAQFIKMVRTGLNYFHLFSIKVYAK